MFQVAGQFAYTESLGGIDEVGSLLFAGSTTDLRRRGARNRLRLLWGDLASNCSIAAIWSWRIIFVNSAMSMTPSPL